MFRKVGRVERRPYRALPTEARACNRETRFIENGFVARLRAVRLYIDNCLPLTVESFHQLAFFILGREPISYCRFKRIDIYVL